MDRGYCFKLVLAYDGTDFCGWERQAQGERTVQGVLEESLFKLTGKSISVAGAGRTDSGVHALGQAASFRIDRALPERTVQNGLNAHLPRDLRVLEAARAPGDFHARYSARLKSYFYQIREAPFDDPFRSRFFHRLKRLPDAVRVRAAAARLVGERDFSALQAAGSAVRTTRRRVRSIKVQNGKDWLRIIMTADGFLYRMARNMVSLIMAQAEGEISEEEASSILASGDRGLAPPTFPAKGLFLWKVYY
jgi:tRNA pseudouridine38-40 synthase